MNRFLIALAFVGLASNASAQTEKYDYQVMLQKPQLSIANAALSFFGSKHKLMSADFGYGVAVKNGEEHIFLPAVAATLQCADEKYGMELDLIVPTDPEVSSAEQARLASRGYKPMGAARTVAMFGSTSKSGLLPGMSTTLISMLNDACSPKYSESGPMFAVTLWYKTAPDKSISGYSQETDIVATYTPISTRRWNEIVTKK